MLNIDFLFMGPRCVNGRTLVFLAWKHRMAQHSGFYGHSEMQGVPYGDVERRCWPSFFFHHQDVQSKKWKHPWYKNMQWSFHTNYYRVALFGVWSTYPHKGVLRPRINRFENITPRIDFALKCSQFEMTAAMQFESITSCCNSVPLFVLHIP